MPEAVLFDLDGTLADTAPDLGAALNQLLLEQGREPLPMEKLRPHVSSGARGMIGAALTDIGGTGLVDIEGDYECEIITEGWATVSAHVRVSAEVGAVVPTLITRWFDATTRDTTGAVALAANTLQTLTLTNLNGQRRALLTFTIASGESLTFDRAEFNGQ